MSCEQVRGTCASTHSSIDPSPEPPFANVFQRRGDPVRVDEIFNVESSPGRDLRLFLDLLLDEEHLTDVRDLDRLTSYTCQPLTLQECR